MGELKENNPQNNPAAAEDLPKTYSEEEVEKKITSELERRMEAAQKKWEQTARKQVAEAERLKEYKQDQEEHIKQWGDIYQNLGMVFAREDGYYIDPSTFRDKYRAMLKKAGLKSYTFHALRHTFVTRALEAGVPIKVVSKILGHASVQITMDTYMYVLPELQNEAMNRIAEFMSA